ncbi:MAG TPA: hypothetical protein ACFYD6_08425 [Candidatus Brocadiia bacterium]|nr:hypothetical protein [Candidatus Brocadiales bacterium]
MLKPIEGKVIKILDEYSIVINLGWKDGLADGMNVVVFALGSEEVKDPNTGESLGYLELVKAHLKVTHVQERCSICAAELVKKAGEEEGGVQTLGAAMMAEAMGIKYSRQYTTEKLNVNTSQISGTPQVGPICIGDKVRCMESKVSHGESASGTT